MAGTKPAEVLDAAPVPLSHYYTTDVSLKVLGRSVEHRSIRVYRKMIANKRSTIVFGGFHGDEPKSVYVAFRLIEALAALPDKSIFGSWVVVPIVNPDGFARRKRRNANKVDLNRNFPTANFSPGSRRSRMYGGPSPASEPETRYIVDLIETEQPTRIVTIHSIGRNRFCNNYDGPAEDWAKSMSRLNGYPVAASIGYPTPGSFGTWAGIERRIPTITLELPSLDSSRQCWQDNAQALLLPASQ